MASCEKCWRDAGGDPERCRALIAARTETANQCTPEEQAGDEDAGLCGMCGRKTIHCIVGRCMNKLCNWYLEIHKPEEVADAMPNL